MSEKIRANVGTPKPQLLKIYKEHITELAQQIEDLKSTKQVAEEKKTSSAIVTANTVKIATVEDLLNSIIKAKQEFEEINLAIQAKKNELKEVHQIEVEANSLAALISAKSKFAEEQDVELQTLREEAEQSAKDLVEAAQKKADEIRKAIKEEEDRNRIEKARREEQYEYDFARKSKEKNDALQDMLDKKARSLDERQETINKTTLDLNEREAKIKAQEEEIKTIKETTEKAIADAVAKAVASEQKSAAISANIAKNKHEAEINLLNERNGSLTTQMAAAYKEIEALKAAVAKANAQVQEVAIQALQAKAEASRPLVVGGNDNNSKR